MAATGTRRTAKHGYCRNKRPERGKMSGRWGGRANYSLLGIAEVVKSSYLCTRKIDNISNYE